MRILLDDEKMGWDEAFDQTVKTMSYTNHTIMSEALEKWPVSLIERVQPRIMQIIAEIDRRYALELAVLLVMAHDTLKTGRNEEVFLAESQQTSFFV